jgi:hypothetical protein
MNNESQLDRIEEKMDRILDLLEPKELSVSVQCDGIELAKITSLVWESHARLASQGLL